MSERGPESGDTSGSDAGALRRANVQQSRMKRLERLHSNGDTSMAGVAVHKVCCVCGTDLNHRPRFKDSEGRYWCPQCNEADQVHKQLMPCADCGIEMPRSELQKFQGELLCDVCTARRRSNAPALYVKTAPHSSVAANQRQRESNVMWVLVLIAGALMLTMGLIWLLHMAV